MKLKLKQNKKKGFTLIEVLVVIAIIGILSTIASAALSKARSNTRVATAGVAQSELRKANAMYYNDMGFYPPDVNRGWDPGFSKPLPSNPDIDAGETPPNGYDVPDTNCNHCPANWQDIVSEKWSGPYMRLWPRKTPWGGKYDYNYWAGGATRNGCPVEAGVYIGVESDYSGANGITSYGENKMIEEGFDSENCVNGESQLLLWKL